MKKSHRLLFFSALLTLSAAVCPCLCPDAAAQLVASDNLPDSPSPALDQSAKQTAHPQSSSSQPPQGTKTNRDDTEDVPPPKRLFGIVPNFRSVSTRVTLPPQTVREKFSDATQDSFDYSSLALASAVAAEGYIATSDVEFGRGGLGYARYLWHSATDQTIENYLVEFIIPVITHEDTRFYTLSRSGFAKRAGYSLGQVFVTKSDSGKRTFNAGEIFGAAAAAGISNFYYPRPERTLSNFGTKYATNVGIDAASYFVKEFYPEISHVFSRRKQKATP